MVASVGSGFAFHRRVLAVGRLAARAVDEVGDAAVHLDRDHVRALRELVQQLGRHAGDLGLTVHDLVERHPIPGRQLGAQRRLVYVAERLLMPLQQPGVERPPTTVAGLHLRRDHDMGVQLRIVGTARRLAEHRSGQPAGVGVEPCPVRADAGRRPIPLDHRHRGVDGPVVTLGEPVVARESPQHRHRLRRRERRVIARHRLGDVAVPVDPVEQLTPEDLAGDRVPARQERFERLGRHLAARPNDAACRPSHRPGNSPSCSVR